MEHVIKTSDDETAATPADEILQPISIRKLDRLETTSPSQSGD